ncbi:MAG: hypothetical protein AAGC55_14705 [Myxococcota bacterium]
MSKRYGGRNVRPILGDGEQTLAVVESTPTSGNGDSEIANKSADKDTAKGPADGGMGTMIASLLGRNNDDMVEVTVGPITIRVRPLDLDIAQNRLQAELDRAVQEKNTDDSNAYGRSTAELKDMAIAAGYFGSTAHNAWAEAASARVGGVISVQWWQDFDPFGGTAGNGPDVLPQGQYPGAFSRIAMGHDTDWSLGRYFGVGPLSALRGSDRAPVILGAVGLFFANNIAVGTNPLVIYTDGHEDWQVEYN